MTQERKEAAKSYIDAEHAGALIDKSVEIDYGKDSTEKALFNVSDDDFDRINDKYNDSDDDSDRDDSEAGAEAGAAGAAGGEEEEEEADVEAINAMREEDKTKVGRRHLNSTLCPDGDILYKKSALKSWQCCPEGEIPTRINNKCKDIFRAGRRSDRLKRKKNMKYIYNDLKYIYTGVFTPLTGEDQRDIQDAVTKDTARRAERQESSQKKLSIDDLFGGAAHSDGRSEYASRDASRDASETVVIGSVDSDILVNTYYIENILKQNRTTRDDLYGLDQSIHGGEYVKNEEAEKIEIEGTSISSSSSIDNILTMAGKQLRSMCSSCSPRRRWCRRVCDDAVVVAAEEEDGEILGGALFSNKDIKKSWKKAAILLNKKSDIKIIFDKLDNNQYISRNDIKLLSSIRKNITNEQELFNLKK